MNELVQYLVNTIQQIPYPASSEKTPAVVEQAEKAHDILCTYRGNRYTLIEALNAFMETGNLAYTYAGIAKILVSASMVNGNTYDKDALNLAETYVQKTRQLDSENFYAEMAMVSIYGHKKDYSGQRLIIDRIRKMPEAQSNCHYALMEADYCWRFRKDDEYREWRKKAVSFIKNDTQSMYVMAAYAEDLRAERKPFEAIEAYKKIEKLSQNDPWYFVNVASLYLSTDQLDMSEKYARRALEIADFGMPHHILGLIKKRRSLSYRLKRFFFGKAE